DAVCSIVRSRSVTSCDHAALLLSLDLSDTAAKVYFDEVPSAATSVLAPSFLSTKPLIGCTSNTPIRTTTTAITTICLVFIGLIYYYSTVLLCLSFSTKTFACMNLDT